MKYKVAPSILSADFTQLGKQMKEIEEAGAEYLHFDVMDGMFVPNISFGIPVMKSIRSATGQVMDAHLMVQDPIRYVEAFKEAGADLITVHFEACPDVRACLEKIKEAGLKVGLSICPATPVEVVKEYLDIVDMILVMSVVPGAGGQAFMPESLERIKKVREMIAQSGREIDIQVDGGIKVSNAKDVLDAGANILVAGSAIFKGNLAENTKDFLEIMKDYE